MGMPVQLRRTPPPVQLRPAPPLDPIANAVSLSYVGETHLSRGDPFTAAVAFGVAACSVADPVTGWLPRQRGEEALFLFRDGRRGAFRQKRARECADDLRAYAAWKVEEEEEARRRETAKRRAEEEARARGRGDALLAGLSSLVHFGASPLEVARGEALPLEDASEAERWRGVARAAVEAGSW